MNDHVSELKEEILTFLRIDEDRRIRVDVLKRTYLNKGYSNTEFIWAYNSLKMESKINGDVDEMWLVK